MDRGVVADSHCFPFRQHFLALSGKDVSDISERGNDETSNLTTPSPPPYFGRFQFHSDARARYLLYIRGGAK